MMPWKGKYLFCNSDDDSREDRLKQRITRAFEKAEEDGCDLDSLGEWGVDNLADRLFEKINNFFHIQAVPR